MRVGLGTGSTVAYLLPALAERALRGVALRGHLAGDRAGGARAGLDRGRARRGRRAGHRDRRRRPGRPARMAGQGRRRRADTREDRRGGSAAVRGDRLGREGRRERCARRCRWRCCASARGVRWRRSARRGCADELESPDGNLIADYFGPVEDPTSLAARLSATPGVVEHGLFAPEMVSGILIAGEHGIEHRAGGKRAV